MSYDANVLRRATQRLEEERRARADQTERRRLAAYRIPATGGRGGLCERVPVGCVPPARPACPPDR